VVAHENITARKLAEAALQQQLAELEVLHTISSVLRMAETRVAALTCLLDETLAALNTNAGAIWLYHDESDELRVAVDRGWFAQVKQTSLRPDAGIGGSVFATGQTYISTEFRTDPRIDAALCAQAPPGWGGACLPLRIAGIKTVGVLYIAVPHARQIMAEQVKLLEALADMGGTTLQRIGLYEETVRQVDRLQSLRRIDEAIIASTDLRMSLSVVLDHVVAQLDVDAADILLLDPNAQTLSFAVGRGFRRDSLQHLRVRLGEGYAGLAALDRHLIYVPDLRQREIEFPRALLFMEERFVSYYVLPLIAKGQIKGVLEVFRRTPLAVGRDWVSFLETLAGQAAIAIDNAQLFEHLQRSNVNLALAYDATIEGWSRAMDLRDKETEGHTLRVTEVTERLAQAMGIDGAELVHIRRGALLHDIGKIGVPDGVLLKPGPLTDEEWVVMRRHPQLAYEMLAPISYLRLALDIPYCHHEKWDGTGYPRGLKGDQIPLSARLFAVVDVWDALRSDRPYRNGWPEERTLAHIRSLSGTHFDPKAVELFLQLRNETNAGSR
jgi:putative nucleotidyltransferase with HDIG domain